MNLLQHRIDSADLDRMTDALFFEGMRRRAKTSRFWVLLLLSGVIATLGVMQDSTATVIGAMIVAPLMTPIIGTALAFVLTDRKMLVRSIVFVLVGAVSVIAIGFLFGTVDFLWSSVGNSQVSSRVSPALIDLLAALATGVVGAFALVRADVSDTLPGVAIAISLVPPLAVCGLVLSEGNYSEAFGALVLFATNVSAIVLTGTIVLLLYKVREVAKEQGRVIRHLTKKSVAALVAMVVIVAIPLAFGSSTVILDQRINIIATPIAKKWADGQGWQLTQINASQGTLNIVALGRPPELNPDTLRQQLNDAGLDNVDMNVTLVIGGSQEFPGTG